MDQPLLDLLRRVDTPTVCNAIEVAQGKRGFAGFTRGTMLCSDPAGGPVVGYAVTARIRAAAPPEEPPEAVRALRLDYYRRMAEAPEPAVAVIEDEDFPACTGAFWGEVNARIHKGFGLSGALTNGVMRDLGDLPAGFPVIAGSVGPSHGFVHVRALDVPVTVFGLTVRPGDLIHADRHGAVAVPAGIVPRLAQAVATLQATERSLLDRLGAGRLDFATFEGAWQAFEQARR